MHEARCEFLRKNQRSQPQIQQIPVNLHPNTNQINGNFNLDRNPSISQYQNIPPRQNNQLYNLSYDPRPNLPINNLNPNNFNNSRQNLNEPNLIPSTNRSSINNFYFYLYNCKKTKHVHIAKKAFFKTD